MFWWISDPDMITFKLYVQIVNFVCQKLFKLKKLRNSPKLSGFKIVGGCMKLDGIVAYCKFTKINCKRVRH